MSDLTFITLAGVGFLVMIGVLCSISWMIV